MPSLLPDRASNVAGRPYNEPNRQRERPVSIRSACGLVGVLEKCTWPCGIFFSVSTQPLIPEEVLGLGLCIPQGSSYARASGGKHWLAAQAEPEPDYSLTVLILHCGKKMYHFVQAIRARTLMSSTTQPCDGIQKDDVFVVGACKAKLLQVKVKSTPFLVSVPHQYHRSRLLPTSQRHSLLGN